MGEDYTPTPEELQQLKQFVAEMFRQNVKISSPELDAMYQEGFREGFIEGFREGLAAMKFVFAASHDELERTIQEGKLVIAGEGQNGDQSDRKPETNKNRDFYG